MDNVTLAALNRSIVHWKDNAKALHPDDVELGPTSCALCRIFWKRGKTDAEGLVRVTCNGCPVAAATGQNGCRGTPYDDAENALGSWDDAEDGTAEANQARDTFRGIAMAEMRFLESLRPIGVDA